MQPLAGDSTLPHGITITNELHDIAARHALTGICSRRTISHIVQDHGCCLQQPTADALARPSSTLLTYLELRDDVTGRVNARRSKKDAMTHNVVSGKSGKSTSRAREKHVGRYTRTESSVLRAETTKRRGKRRACGESNTSLR